MNTKLKIKSSSNSIPDKVYFKQDTDSCSV